MIRYLTAWLFVSVAHAADPIAVLPSGAVDATDPNKAIGVLVNRILSGLLAVGYPLAFLSLVVSAYLLISSGGKPDAYTKARKNILYLTTGIFLIVAATSLVRFFINLACTNTGGCFG